MTPHSNEAQALTLETSGRRYRLLMFLALLAALGVGLGVWIRARAVSHTGSVAAAPHERKQPVIVATLRPKAFPLLLEGLGTVTPLVTVTVKAQVEGRLLSLVFNEGSQVHRGQLLAEIDPRPFRIGLAQARATQARDEAQLQNAKLDLDRYEKLRDQNLVAAQQLDAQRSQVAQLTAVLDIDRALADDAALQLEYTRIYSPIDAVAGIRKVDPGNLIRATDTSGIVVLTQLDPIAVLFTLPQDELPRIAAALAAGPRKVQALSRAGDQVLAQGELTVIDNQVDSSTGTVRFKAQFSNANRALWPNQFVRARLEVNTREGALTLPAAAVQHGPNGSFVYVVGPGDVAKLRPVTVDVLQADEVLIGSGLKVGERVVIDGQDQLKPNARVEPRDSAGETKTHSAAETKTHPRDHETAPSSP